MGILFFQESVNIDAYPSLDAKHFASLNKELSLGDLHGNAVKLLYFLTRHGFLEISKQNYGEIVKIYHTPHNTLRYDQIQRFQAIIQDLKVNTVGKIRLLGDELADRGKNDYFTLKILEKLHQGRANIEILLSNHSADFIYAYENKLPLRPHTLDIGFTGSLLALQELIDHKWVQREEIDQIVKECYYQMIMPLSYTANGSSITIYSHALIDIEDIKHEASLLNTEFVDDTLVNLAKSIDRINVEFYSRHTKVNRIHDLLNPNAMLNGYAGVDQERKKDPFVHLIWNRNANILNRSPIHKGYQVNYVHGHHPDKRGQHGNIYNLDNILGKDPNYHQGMYTIVSAGEFSS